YPGSIRTSDIATEAALGSPFKIGLSATYSPSTNTYAVTANIKSFGTIASGLKAQVVLTVDTMTYALNQSTETIPQYVFPQVAEDMMPNSNGTTLTAFTPEQTQTVNVSWVKNHPWAANRSAYAYDSTTTHITVFIQNNSGKYIYQSATCVPSILLGIKENSSLSYLDIYPNPATNVATVAFGMKQSENVLITVYNMLGQKVMTENEGVLAQGEHSVKLDASDLSNGIYYVNVITDNNSITKKIIISK
ncbi:MAG TPA: T9SS type A sorting domain-containing protein, partial [Bacteroidia bacterium]|nr:T9SS type A sorting domain-containing protein [Bacteroidia bacterium]